MSGIVSLLFCGITLKHYAYYNMSRRTQITIKFIFQLLARLSENFIFIYLGLELFTQVELVYKPVLIIITAASICVARWCSVFPLSRLINWIYRVKTVRSIRNSSTSSISIPDEIPYNYQVMTFWAGLRGAVGVALAMGLQGEFKFTLLATVLVVVVLTVIIFGGTTAGMLEVLNIRTGCFDENDISDDEFDIEAPRASPLATGPIGNVIQPYSDVNSQEDPSTLAPTGSDTNLMSDIPPLENDNVLGSSLETDPSRSSLDKQGLRDAFGNIFNSDSQWFHNFDEQVLKPVFLDSSTQSTRESGRNSPSTGHKQP